MSMDAPGQWGGAGEDYRLARITPAPRPADRAPEEPSSRVPAWSVPERSRSVGWFEVVLIVVGTGGIAVSFLSYVQSGGIRPTLTMAALALIPLVFVLGVLVWVDRWEPEPPWTTAVSLVWGAGVAALSASVLNTAALTDMARASGDVDAAMTTVAVVVAPLAEETLKGLGVLLVVIWRRTSINSVIDGVVHGAWCGAGFAFVENVQYFLQAGDGGGASVGVTFVMRGLLSPFVHPLATSLTGAALAWSVVSVRSRSAWLVWGPTGWIGAVAFHGLWNLLAATARGGAWLGAYVLVEMPIFLAWITVLVIASTREGTRIARGLTPYVRTGWVLPAEVSMVSTRGGRRAARAWAGGGGRGAARAMKRFQVATATLGLDQLVMARTGAQPDRLARDRALVASLAPLRETFLRANRPGRDPEEARR